MTKFSPETLETFSRIGQRIMAVREAQGISLNEISVRTKIHPGFLEKIEKGDLENLPNLAFVKGFVRNFMQMLELKDDDLEADLRGLSLEPVEEEGPDTPISKVNVLDIEPTGVPLVKLGFYLVLFAALGGIVYFLYLGMEGENPAAPGKTAETASAPTTETTKLATGKNPEKGAEKSAGSLPPKITGNPSPPTKPAPEARPAKSPVPALPPVAQATPKNLNLTIRGLQRTWVRLTIDKKPPVDVLVEAAETQRWEADQEFRLIVGKSHGVAVFLNGLDFPLLKESNQLIPELVLDKLALLKLENCSAQGGC